MPFNGLEDTRLDVFLAGNLQGEASRSRLKGLIRDGLIKVNKRLVTKPSYRLRAGDVVEVEIPPPKSLDLTPQDVPFEILYEDQALAVISKPPGVVVHPAPGHLEGTLVHGLIGRLKELSSIAGTLRPGIVHRLDKGTSGVMLVAKSDVAHQRISEDLKAGKIKKHYIALAYSKEQVVPKIIDLPIGRDRVHRKKMRIDLRSGKPALTAWKVLEGKKNIYLLYLRIKTGRTHQIRVHLASQGIKILGDSLYGLSPRASMELPCISELNLRVERTMLHAYSIGFYHPETGTWMEFEKTPYEDMTHILEALYSIGPKELEKRLRSEQILEEQSSK